VILFLLLFLATLTGTVSRHHVVDTAVVCWLVNAAISTMPPLAPDDPRWWVWLHNFLQVVGANLDKLKTRKANGGTPAA
jgi:hypothetical protein